MDKILHGDNVEGWEDHVGITQFTMTFQFYTVDVLLITWSYLFVHVFPCTTLHIVVQNYLVVFKCLVFKCDWLFLSWLLLLFENVQKAFFSPLGISSWLCLTKNFCLSVSLASLCSAHHNFFPHLIQPSWREFHASHQYLRIRSKEALVGKYFSGAWSAVHLSWFPLLSLILSLLYL